MLQPFAGELLDMLDAAVHAGQYRRAHQVPFDGFRASLLALGERDGGSIQARIIARIQLHGDSGVGSQPRSRRSTDGRRVP